MSDLISRQDAIDELEYMSANYTGQGVREWHPHIREAQDVIRHIQSAEPERKTGTWIGEWDAYDLDGEPIVDIWRCSVCDKVFDEWEDKPDWKYCPNCGARLEDHEEEDEVIDEDAG